MPWSMSFASPMFELRIRAREPLPGNAPPTVPLPHAVSFGNVDANDAMSPFRGLIAPMSRIADLLAIFTSVPRFR